MKKLYIIVAGTRKLGIGLNGKLPWVLPEDLKYFKDTTTKTENPNKINCCIMGRKTYFSIPKSYRPLTKRFNIVLSSNTQYKKLIEKEGATVANNFRQAVEISNSRDEVENTFVIGGEQVYKDALNFGHCDAIYYTLVLYDFECDVFFPKIDSNIFQIETVKPSLSKHHDIGYEFIKYVTK